MVAPQRRDVREKEVRDENRLRRPEMREGRHQRVAGRCGLPAQRGDTRPRLPCCSTGIRRRRYKPQIERHLLVARSAGVQATAGVAEPLDEQPLDEAVDVLVGAVDERRVGAAPLEDVAKRRLDLRPRPRLSGRRRSRARAPTPGCRSRRLRTAGDRTGTTRPNSNAAASGVVSNRPDHKRGHQSPLRHLVFGTATS